MKKITSILTALALICTLTACSKGGGSESAQSFTAEKLSDVAYKQEKLPLPENASILYGAVPFDSGNKVYMLGAAEVSPAFWIADRDLGKFERRDLPDFDIGIIYNFGVSNDGEFAVITVHADYGDLPAPDPSSPDYDEARYDAAAEYSLRLMVYGADGKLKSDVTVEDYREQVGKQTMLGDSAFDGKHMVDNIGGGFEVFSAEGKYLGELTAGEGETICDVSVDSTGRLVCAVEVENGTVTVTRPNDDKRLRSLHGLTRTLIHNMVEGVTNGYSKTLEIEGVGYRAAKSGNKVTLNLGFSHPVILEETDSIKIDVPQPNKLVITGIDKQAVGQFAAEVREKRTPEPYKGKGIRYAGERIIRKEGKAGKGKK